MVARQRAQAEAWEADLRAAESQHAQRAHALDTREAALEERAASLDEASEHLEAMRAEVVRDAADGQVALEAVHAEQIRLKVPVLGWCCCCCCDA